MTFCSGVEDNIIISIANEINDERIVKVFSVLNERLQKYNNELNQLNNVNTTKTKKIQKIENKVKLIEKCKSNNLFKIQRYQINKDCSITPPNIIYEQKYNVNNSNIKIMKNNKTNSNTNSNININTKININKCETEINIRNESKSIKENVKIMEEYNEMYFPRLNLLCNKDLHINVIKEVICTRYPNFDGFIKKNKNLRNKSLFSIIFFNSKKNNNDNKLLVKHTLECNEQYVINKDKYNLYFEIDKRDINNNYSYLLH